MEENRGAARPEASSRPPLNYPVGALRLRQVPGGTGKPPFFTLLWGFPLHPGLPLKEA